MVKQCGSIGQGKQGNVIMERELNGFIRKANWKGKRIQK
jgi:hypothetical protein